jgi:hypothetical protein
MMTEMAAAQIGKASKRTLSSAQITQAQIGRVIKAGQIRGLTVSEIKLTYESLVVIFTPKGVTTRTTSNDWD